MMGRSQRTAYEVLEVRDNASQTVIDAAFRALAGIYHPDRNPAPGAERQMAEVNRTYALIRTRELRQVYDRLRTPVNPDRTVSPTYASAESAKRPAPDVLDFGRYAGWSLGDLARHDPNYLRWLSRHSSGIRYRQRIDQLLAVPQSMTASKRIRGR